VTRRQERGYAALALVALLSLVGAAIIARAMTLSAVRQDRREERFTRIALSEARAALIAKAALEDNTPGALLCPDSSSSITDANYGEANSCGDAGTSGESMGCVPWKTLGIPPPAQYGIAPLWYVMSADLRSASFTARDRTTASRQINPDNLGQLTLVNMDTGTVVPILAAVIAPGPALDTQTRSVDSCSPLQASAYLDTATSALGGTVSNADRSKRIAQGAASNDFNDVVMPIEQAGLMRQVIPNVLQALATAPLANGGITSTGQTLAFARGDTLSSQAHYDDTLWSIWPNGTDLSSASEPTTCSRGTLSGIDYGCAGTRVNAAGATVNEYCFTPAAGTRTPAAWLCFNRWYDYVSYSAGADGGAIVSASAGNTRCTLHTSSAATSLACNDSGQ
jgi:hypothetical protein